MAKLLCIRYLSNEYQEWIGWDLIYTIYPSTASPPLSGELKELVGSSAIECGFKLKERQKICTRAIDCTDAHVNSRRIPANFTIYIKVNAQYSALNSSALMAL